MRITSSFLPIVMILTLASFVVPAISAENYATASGGVSDEDRISFNAAHSSESLKLTFAGPAGEYLSDVMVSIRNNKNDEVVSATSSGPIFVAALPTGSYTIMASLDGETKTQRVTIGKGGARKSVTLRFSGAH